MQPELFFSYAFPFFLGGLFGLACFWSFHYFKVGSYKKLAAELLRNAENDASIYKNAFELEIKQKKLDQQQELEKQWQKERRKIFHEEQLLKNKEEKISLYQEEINNKKSAIEKKELSINRKREKLHEREEEIEEIKTRLLNELEKVSGFTHGEARDLFLRRIETQLKTDAANLSRKIISEAKEDAEREASSIIATAINRLAANTVSEVTVTTLPLPNDEMKGRVIGREGRNIRALEQSTGVNFVIEDSPCSVVISGFDPVRKEIAKLALKELIDDGRIHPQRIEETVKKTKIKIDKCIREYGEDAALRAGAINLHPNIINLLGRLKYRYSYGQNILEHSLEVSHIMGIMAAELNLDVTIAKRIGLLHDMGKAVTHEIEGSHAIIGHDLALKWGEDPKVANGIGCHHNELPPESIEASLCSAADAISASRPGARIEAVEEYTRRLKKLETIAEKFPGVEKAYAMQAGREIRVIVEPDEVDDAGVTNMAREMAHRIENELHFPGKIKVTIIRERRCVEYAL